jgi:glycerol-3-phosphate dehydrogenase
LVNYLSVSEILKNEQGAASGVVASDGESGRRLEISARSVVNAAGPFCDQVRRLDDARCEPMIAASQGIHLVLPKEFFPGETAMIVPKTSDGRVIFIVPWHDHAIVGTTDTAIPNAVPEPSPRPEEIQFLLDTASEYLTRPPTIDDVLSIFTGIRPLVKGDKSSRTASLSRDHVIRVSDSKLITITGGKWTTVRKMAEDCVDKVIDTADLTARGCVTMNLPIHGSDETEIRQLEKEHPDLAEPLHDGLNIRCSQVIWAARNEMARTIEDVLARRTRMLFLNANAAISAAPAVAELIARELGTDQLWRDRQLEAFATVAAHYTPNTPHPAD